MQSSIKIREKRAKTILSKSKVSDYTINPYVGCAHGCKYCYARFIKRYTSHKESWGEFVDVKINAPDLLEKEVLRKKKGKVWISGVCDPYQPLEKKYKITRKCLEILQRHDWPVMIQTKSPLVLRDIDLLKKFNEVEVGFTIGTGDEKIREIFEPRAPPIEERVEALKELHKAGIETFVMIAPLLPGADLLVEKLKGKVDYVLIDKMNYHYADWVYKKHNLEYAMEDKFFREMKNKLRKGFEESGISCEVIF